ncbi:MAG: trypsin-like peptidase domain-containing protein [Bacteriovoracaceae bacterium]
MMKLFFGLCLWLLANNAFAFPIAPFDALKSNIEPPLYENALSYDFEGIVKLSNCSGSIIKFQGQSLDDNAIVLTNGHCLGGRFLQPGEVAYKKPSRRRMRVADKNMRFHSITAKELIYGTMTDTDAALYRLRETYNDLEKLGIQAFELSNQRPQVGTAIEVVSGYWERGYSCAIDDFVHILKEASWTFTDSIRYTSPGCEIIGGTSGSPIIQSGTRIVIGVNNTANQSGRRCAMNNPCEVDKNNSVSVRRGAGYGQQTYLFYTCLNAQNDIDLSLAGCKLPK